MRELYLELLAARLQTGMSTATDKGKLIPLYSMLKQKYTDSDEKARYIEMLEK